MEFGKPFTAWWIGPAYDPRKDHGFFEFALDFSLDSIPETLTVRVSADQRYCLLVNGVICSRGPQRGDAQHWHYETLDIAPHLQAGPNRIVAEVTNFGWLAPMAQHTVRTAFLLQAEEPFGELSTSGNWLVRCRADRDFAMMSDGIGDYYIDVGPGEIFLLDPDIRHDEWKPAHRICRAEIRGEPGGGSPWSLIPRTIPIEGIGEKVSPLNAVLRRNGTEEVTAYTEFSIKAGDEWILDFGELVVGFPSFWFSSDEAVNGDVRITYCESLVDQAGKKGNRSQTEGKFAKGYEDLVQFRGANHAGIHPSWIRTFRYISIRSNADISQVEVSAFRSGYPMDVQAVFHCDDDSAAPIWDMSIRTLKLCAGETYYDCPYYEQLQYIGDTRLQALIGYYLSSDRTLQRNAIEQFHWSVLENELTQSRYPSRQMQVIPPFSLWWVVMVYDAWMHDPEFDCQPYQFAMGRVTQEFLKVMLGRLEPFWNFGDWIEEWKWGVPPESGMTGMHFDLLQLALWCYGKTLAEDGIEPRPSKVEVGLDSTTEHSAALQRYFQYLAGEPVDPWPNQEFQAKCTYFWQFYKHVAMQPEDYLTELEPWREMLRLGLTTTPETPEPTRSDCHGWSAHPPLGFFQLIAGVSSAAPGWKKCRIAPKPGKLKWFEARIPHPNGELEVKFESGKLSISCPVPYELIWNGKREWFEAGEQSF